MRAQVNIHRCKEWARQAYINTYVWGKKHFKKRDVVKGKAVLIPSMLCYLEYFHSAAISNNYVTERLPQRSWKIVMEREISYYL